MLMDFVMNAVIDHSLSRISRDQALLQKAEEPCERKPVELLVGGSAFNGRNGNEGGIKM
jgi:hypothetical protein